MRDSRTVGFFEPGHGRRRNEEDGSPYLAGQAIEDIAVGGFATERMIFQRKNSSGGEKHTSLDRLIECRFPG